MQKLVWTTFFLLIGKLACSQQSDFWNTYFHKADSIAYSYEGHPLSNPPKLAELLTKDLSTDVEKFRAIFRWITDNISYDYELYIQNEIKKQKFAYNKPKMNAWRKKFETKTFKKTIKEKTAVCSGYSLLLEMMCNHVGIQCVTIEGYGRAPDSIIGSGKPNHAWNAVWINHKWYLCDATWASGYCDRGTQRFYKKYNNIYFLTDPYLFIADHYPLESKWILIKDKPTLRQFLNAPLKDDGYFTNKINQYSPSEGIIKCKKNETVNFRFTCNVETAREKASLRIEDEKKEVIHLFIWLKKNDEGQFLIQHCFDREGTFDIAIYINERLTLRYKVVVS